MIMSNTLTRTINVNYPEGLSEILANPPESFDAKIKFMAAAKLYELGEIDSGSAAVLAGMERIEFIDKLKSVHVSVFNCDSGELARQIEDAKEFRTLLK